MPISALDLYHFLFISSGANMREQTVKVECQVFKPFAGLEYMFMECSAETAVNNFTLTN